MQDTRNVQDGDTVICTNNRGVEKFVTRGNAYRVDCVSTDGIYLYLEGFDHYPFMINRFRKAGTGGPFSKYASSLSTGVLCAGY